MSTLERRIRVDWPEEYRLLNAFSIPNSVYSAVGDSLIAGEQLPDEKLSPVVQSYFSASFIYFKGHSDERLRTVGENIASAIRGHVLTAVVNSSGVREKYSSLGGIKEAQLQTFVVPQEERSKDVKEVVLLIPDNFIVLARQKPTEALSDILGYFSRIGDLLDDGLQSRSSMAKRAKDIQAYFLEKAENLFQT